MCWCRSNLEHFHYLVLNIFYLPADGRQGKYGTMEFFRPLTTTFEIMLLLIILLFNLISFSPMIEFFIFISQLFITNIQNASHIPRHINHNKGDFSKRGSRSGWQTIGKTNGNRFMDFYPKYLLITSHRLVENNTWPTIFRI